MTQPKKRDAFQAFSNTRRHRSGLQYLVPGIWQGISQKQNGFRAPGLSRNSQKASSPQQKSRPTTRTQRRPGREGRGVCCEAGLDAKPGRGVDGIGGRGGGGPLLIYYYSLLYNGSK